MFAAVFIKPRTVEGVCASTVSRVYEALVLSAATISNPAEAKNYLLVLYNILFNRELTPCDENGNPTTPPPTDPNVTAGPTPTTDPNAPTPQPGNPGDWPFFCQLDPQVQDSSIASIRDNGCGPTGMSMIYCKLTGKDNQSKWGCDYKPSEMAKAFKDGYTNMTIYSPALTAVKSIGLYNVSAGSDLSVWEKFLANNDDSDPSNNTYIWAGSRDIPCGIDCGQTRGIDDCINKKDSCWRLRHVFVIDKVDVANNRFRVRNPNDCTWRSNENTEEYTSGGQWWNEGDFTIFVAYAITKK